MLYQVQLKTSGKTFSVEADETVLEAALRQGINLPYGCKNGACGSCKGKCIEGKIRHGDHSQSALSAADETAGSTLLCCAHPQTDLLIEVREVQGGGDIPVRKVPCRINTIQFPSDDVAILQLQLPASERFQFLAGQYLEFLLKDNKRRAYSIASAPHEQGPLELHIRHLPGGVFTDFVFGAASPALKEKDILQLVDFGNINDLKLVFKYNDIRGPKKPSEVFQELYSNWKEDILKSQIVKAYLGSISIIRPFKNVVGGFIELFKQPYESYKHDTSFEEGLVNGVKKFVVTFTTESLMLGEKVYNNLFRYLVYLIK